MRRIRITGYLVVLAMTIAACGDDSSTAADGPAPDDEAAPGEEAEPDLDEEADEEAEDEEEPEPAPLPPPASGDETEADRYAAATFSDPTTIDNEWMPLVPGTRMTMQGTTTEDDASLPHTVISTVTDLTKVIDGIPTVVLWDQDFSDGVLVETEIAFFAQDDEGNVWRMGEYPEEYVDGVLFAAPAWLVGQAGAIAGVAMLADPQLGTPSYSQGWGPEVGFIDRGQVGLMGQRTCVPVDCYEDVLVIDEFNVVEAGAFQTKFFARGVGNVRVGWRGADEGQEELEMSGLETLDEAGMEEARAASLALEANAYAGDAAYAGTEPIAG